jgi:hypothetical protein
MDTEQILLIFFDKRQWGHSYDKIAKVYTGKYEDLIPTDKFHSVFSGNIRNKTREWVDMEKMVEQAFDL